jgi:hypothetical protein
MAKLNLWRMNMKRLLAFAFLAISMIAGLGSAHAAVPSDCHLISTNGTGWPYTSAYYCGNLNASATFFL